jgi:hypothetical protein
MSHDSHPQPQLIKYMSHNSKQEGAQNTVGRMISVDEYSKNKIF